MTIIYKLEITAQFDDEKLDQAEQAILDEKRKAAWQKKVAKAFERFAPDANIVCSDIKVFPEV